MSLQKHLARVQRGVYKGALFVTRYAEKSETINRSIQSRLPQAFLRIVHHSVRGEALIEETGVDVHGILYIKINKKSTE